MMKNNNIPNIPAEKFQFVADAERMHDQKMDTKQISYFRDALNRFSRNKGSVFAGIIILLLVLYAILVPMLCTTTYAANTTDTLYLQYTELSPRNPLFVKLGWNFWNGTAEKDLSENQYLAYKAMEQETGVPVMLEEYGTYIQIDDQTKQEKTRYEVQVDTYASKGFMYLTLTKDEYVKLQNWQNENNIQVVYPAITDLSQTDANIWYKANKKGVPQLDKNGEFVDIYKRSGVDGDYNSLRIEGDPGIDDPEAQNRYRYANVTGTADATSYKVRVLKQTYFEYRYGFECSFLLGTTGQGYDMLTRLAVAARFSLIFAVCVAAINLTLGAIIGAIEGYYGGMVDMLIERFIDILSRVPFIVVATLFQLHLAAQVGPVWSMLFAFVLTGWIGMAGTTRMQFYRYKGQEYVLASRVLGASDWRIMFRHIFPNSLGTIITSSVLVIPGVIFSESSLTYLGIVNLDSPTLTSVGTMLANGRQYLTTSPHIILFPALFISLLEISFNLFGNGLRDAFNPSLRGAED